MNETLTPYKQGLQRLLELIGKSHPAYHEALIFQARLVENLHRGALFGETESQNAERWTIIGNLNDFTKRILGRSFIELCDLDTFPALQETVSSAEKPPEEIPRSQKNRKKVMDLEETFDRLNLHSLTESHISQIEVDLRDVIMEIRPMPHDASENGIQSKDTVLAKLREACDQLYNALELLKKENRNAHFYKYLRSCQSCLEKVLAAW